MINPYETSFNALERELKEELDIEICEARLVDIVRYTYPDKLTELYFYQIDSFKGEPVPQEN